MFSLIMTWQQLVIALESNGSGPLPRWIKNNKNSREKTPSGVSTRLILLCSLATRAERLSQVLGPTRKRMKSSPSFTDD